MKRIITIILLAALLLSGCSQTDDSRDTVTFYYLRSEIQYGSDDGVLAEEERELSNPDQDLSYLLALYMKGPTDKTLKLPLPAGTRLSQIQTEGDAVTLTFSSELSYLDGMELSIACACISYTCFSLTTAETVTILAPAVNYGTPVELTVTRDSFLLYDNTTRAADAS